MSEKNKRNVNVGSERASDSGQVNEVKMRLYTVAVKKANKSQRKVVMEANQKACFA